MKGSRGPDGLVDNQAEVLAGPHNRHLMPVTIRNPQVSQQGHVGLPAAHWKKRQGRFEKRMNYESGGFGHSIVVKPCTSGLSEFNANVMTGNNGAHQHSPYNPGIQK